MQRTNRWCEIFLHGEIMICFITGIKRVCIYAFIFKKLVQKPMFAGRMVQVF